MWRRCQSRIRRASEAAGESAVGERSAIPETPAPPETPVSTHVRQALSRCVRDKTYTCECTVCALGCDPSRGLRCRGCVCCSGAIAVFSRSRVGKLEGSSPLTEFRPPDGAGGDGIGVTGWNNVVHCMEELLRENANLASQVHVLKCVHAAPRFVGY